MIECLIGLIIYAIIAVIVVYVFEAIVAAIWTPPPPVFMLIRLLVGLIVLLRGLKCLGGLDARFP